MLPDTWVAIVCLGIVILITVLLKCFGFWEGCYSHTRSKTTKEQKDETLSNMQRDAGLWATWLTALHVRCPATLVAAPTINMR